MTKHLTFSKDLVNKTIDNWELVSAYITVEAAKEMKSYIEMSKAWCKMNK